MNLFNRLQQSTLIILALSNVGCADVSSQQQKQASPASQAWKDYWYSGEAELTRYKLEQARYGEIHEGDAVMIFVTEDFRTDQQVKYEGGPKGNVTSVLKLNNTKRFWTGIYPYSLITSSFSPVDGQPALKVSTSAQEWCGHSYSQLNLRKGQYEGLLHSYFQAEGDQEFSLEAALLEDEVWSMIRMRPQDLPTGAISLIPGTQYLRLKHKEFQVEKATVSLISIKDPELSDAPLTKYRIEYEAFSRVLEITFETAFPYTIVAWEEQQADPGKPGMLTTRATRTHSVKSPYWGQNSLADSVMRQRLGFE
jgi:hypothetical protein